MYLDIYFLLVLKQSAENESNLQCTHSESDKPRFEISALEHFEDLGTDDNKNLQLNLQNIGS